MERTFAVGRGQCYHLYLGSVLRHSNENRSIRNTCTTYRPHISELPDKEVQICVTPVENTKRNQWCLLSRSHNHVQLEMISTDGCEIKTTVMTLANHNSQKQHNKPIRIESKSMLQVPSVRKYVQTTRNGFGFASRSQHMKVSASQCIITLHN